MSAIVAHISLPPGLSASEVASLEKKYGKNEIRIKKQFRLLRLMLALVAQPMFMMLLVACSLYFILGETDEGIMMAVA